MAKRKFRQPVKLPEDFDGKQPLNECLMQFECCALINRWNKEGWHYVKIVERLQNRFGIETQAELHQARLLNHNQFEGESLQMLVTDIRSLVDLAYQDLSTLCRNALLYNTFSTHQVRKMIGCTFGGKNLAL